MPDTKAADLERRANIALDRLEKEVAKLEIVSRVIQEQAGKTNGANGDHRSSEDESPGSRSA